MKTEDIEDGTDVDDLQYRFIPLQVVPLKKLVSHTTSTTSQKERVTVVKEAMRSPSAPLSN